MKITLIITDHGSFNNFLAEAAIGLLNSGHEVDVICSKIKVINFNDKFNYKKLGIIFHYVDFPRGFSPLKHYIASKNIHKIINEINPEIISIHFTTGIFTTLFIGKPQAYTLGTFHGLGYPMIENKFKKFVFKHVEEFCFKRLDQIWVINRFDYNLLKSNYQNKLHLLETKGMGCDINKYNRNRFTKEMQTQIKNELKINKNDFVIAFTGRFVRFKGFDLVVKAIMKIRDCEINSNVKLILIGGKDPIHKTGLSIGEENWLLTHKDVINVGFTCEVEKYLSISDLFVFPSEKEGMPVCIIEALSMGIPVITTNSRGCNDLVIDGFNGIVLSNKPKVEEIIDAIIKLKEDSALMSIFKKNILQNRAEFCRSNFVAQQIALLGKYN